MRRVLDELLLDNPILMKHVRSRLRRGQLLPAMSIVLVLCLLIGWLGVAANQFADGTAFGMTMMLQIIILVIIGSSQVASSLGGVRQSNILDFHRISPLPPLAIALGFFFGAPVREYLLFALTLPLSLLAAAQGPPGVLNLLQYVAALILVAWVAHALALVSTLVARKPKANAGGVVVLLFILFGNMAYSLVWSGPLLQRQPTLAFFGMDLPWLLFLALYLGSALTFLLIAATRKMRSERAHALSKPQAVAFLSAATILLLGGLWTVQDFDALVLVVLYVLVGVAAITSVTTAPMAGDYARGLRRAARMGRSRLSIWDDLSLNRPALAVLCLIVLVGATVAWNSIAGGPGPALAPQDRGRVSLAIAVGVVVVAYVGLAYQYFTLAFPKRAAAAFGVFLFFAWAVPLMAGGVAGASGLGEVAAISLLSISPIVGLSMSSGLFPPFPGQDPAQAAQIAAILPPLLFAFVFNQLVTNARRRIRRSVQDVPGPKAEEPGGEDGLVMARGGLHPKGVAGLGDGF